ncbi:hypothetical protein Tco_0372072, partial [Tanacetum coccineum]
MTIYPDSNPFPDNFDNSGDSEDDWDDIIEGIDFGDIPKIKGLELPPFVYNMRKNSKNKGKTLGNYKMTYNDAGPSLSIKQQLTKKETT